MSRCIDPALGVKVLSYDLLEGQERVEMDAHLEACGACRDFRQQTFGKEGALDELAYRAFRLGQRRRVEPHAWILERLRDLWLPLLFVVGLLGAIGVYLVRREPESPSVHIVRLAMSRNASIDSLVPPLAPRLDPNPASVIVRPDRAARAYVYEVHAGTLRRLIPTAEQPPPELSPDRSRELMLPPLEAPDSHVLVVLVPREATGTNAEWDAAVLRRLGGGRSIEAGSDANGWPSKARPTLRWLP